MKTKNRKVLFRAWDTENNEYWYQGSVRFDGSVDSSWGKQKYDWILEQWTGLVDKKGTNIFEGDILKLDNWANYQQVRFIEGAFCLAFMGKEAYGEYAGDIHYVHHANKLQATVVGNIHENPDLGLEG